MSIAIVLYVEVRGDGPRERSIREGLEWLDRLGQYSAEFHEVAAQVAMIKMRQEWLLADQYRRLEGTRRARQAKATARRAAKATTTPPTVDPAAILPHRLRHGM